MVMTTTEFKKFFDLIPETVEEDRVGEEDVKTISHVVGDGEGHHIVLLFKNRS